MRPNLNQRLEQKGWNTQDILHAQKIVEKNDKQDIFFSKIVFWSALVIIIFANIIVSLILIPFLIVLNNVILYSVIALLALVVGFLYNFLITDIGRLGKKHHRAAAVIIPLLGIINMVVVVLISNRFITDVKAQNAPHNPWVAAIVFVVAFIVPYLVDQIVQEFKPKKAVIN